MAAAAPVFLVLSSQAICDCLGCWYFSKYMALKQPKIAVDPSLSSYTIRSSSGATQGLEESSENALCRGAVF